MAEFTRHAVRRFQERLGWYPNAKTRKDISTLIRKGHAVLLRHGNKKDTEVLLVIYCNMRIEVVWSNSKNKIISLWRPKE